MTGGRDAYALLMSALPRPDPLFLAKRPPISRLRLDRRLALLSHDDALRLRRIENALSWRSFRLGDDDEAATTLAREALTAEPSPSLRAAIEERLEMRGFVVALRRRARGEGAPARGAPWAFGPRFDQVRRHWDKPDFGLGAAMGWIAEATKAMAGRDPAAFEAVILEEAYRRLDRRAAGHAFDFEAVVFYVLRWSILRRRLEANRETAARRFDALLGRALSDVDAAMERAL